MLKIEDKVGSNAGGLWTQIISTEYQELHNTLKKNDHKKLRLLLSNFGAAPFTRGISLVGDIPKNIFQYGELLIRFNELIKIYNKLSLQKNLDFPKHFGGIHGAIYKEKFLQVSTFRHNYYAEKMNALLEVGPGNILEIGGGYGGACYQLINFFGYNRKYIIVDIPLQLINAAAFLKQALPSKKVSLMPKFDKKIFDNSDVILVPPNMFSAFSSKHNISIVFNAHSFTEMNFSTTKMYLKGFLKIKPQFFLSFNHEMRYEYNDGGKIKAHSALIDQDFASILATDYSLINRFPELLQSDLYYEYLWIKKIVKSSQ